MGTCIPPPIGFIKKIIIPNLKEITYYVDKKGCWICSSHKCGSHGYPMIKRDGKLTTINRFVWQDNNGAIPAKMVIMHTCDNRLCINPNHLVLGTPKDNTQDAISKGRAFWQKKHKNFVTQ